MVETIGYIGLNHSHRSLYLESLAALPVEITCVCEPDESFDVNRVEGVDMDDVTLYRDPVTLLEDEQIDLAWVTLPNKLTTSVVNAAIDRGVNVFSEKSLARTGEELEPLVDAAAQTDTTVGVSYFNRASPVYRELRDRRNAEFFGDVRAFGANLFSNKLATRLQSEHQPNYLYDADQSGGGIVQWLGCHFLDLFEWILDDPVDRVSAQLSYSDTDVDIEDGATIHLETKSGAQGTLQLGYYLRAGPGPRGDTAVGPAIEPMHIYGMDGAAVIASDGQTVRLGADRPEWDSAPRRTVSFEQADSPGYAGQAGLGYIREFLDMCEGGDSDLVATIDDELRVLRIIDAVYESAETDEWVSPE
jgi:predicted dehydrogenase